MGTHESKTTWDDVVQQGRVHRSVYTDPAIFDVEMRKVFGGTWVYLAHESQLPEPNDFVAVTLGLRPVLLARDRHGELHGLLNRCTHRGATICREERGNARAFTCPYHAWSYSNTGRLVGVPWPQGYEPPLDRDELGLGTARLASYRGFVFGTLNPAAQDLVEHLGPAAELLDQWLDRYPGPITVRSGALRMTYRGNWKLNFDNAADGYHPAFSHRSLLTMVEQRYGAGRDMQYFGQSPDEGGMYVQDLGNGHTFLDQRPEIPGFWRWVRPMPGMEAGEALLTERLGEDKALMQLELGPGSGMNLNIFPNLLIIGNQIQVIRPLAVDHTELTWYSTTVDDLDDHVNTLRMRMQEDFPSFGEPDDLANFEECQRGLSIAEVEWVMCHRGVPDLQETDDRAVVTGRVTDELPIRGYYRQWRRLMSAEPQLTSRWPA
jgi:phenylpropionate dioxygenase-like ring-hydroxylating dioxygenase large terminal subunit